MSDSLTAAWPVHDKAQKGSEPVLHQRIGCTEIKVGRPTDGDPGGDVSDGGGDAWMIGPVSDQGHPVPDLDQTALTNTQAVSAMTA